MRADYATPPTGPQTTNIYGGSWKMQGGTASFHQGPPETPATSNDNRNYYNEYTTTYDLSNTENFVASQGTRLMPESSLHATSAPGAISNVRDFGINTKFNIALTFAGEIRDTLESMLPHLDTAFGENNVFYDNRYTHALSQADLDDLLKDIYKKADLVVVVLSKEYPEKMWCNEVEYPEIQERNKKHKGKHVMYLRADNTSNLPEGMTNKYGYINIWDKTPEYIVGEIKKRFALIRPDWHGQ